MKARRILWASIFLLSGCDGKEDGASKDEGPKSAQGAKADEPAAGSERGPCYGNGTCDEGLACMSDLCVKAALEEKPVEAVPAEASAPSEEANKPTDEPETHPTEFDAFYVGAYGFGVNRVNDGKRNATATIHSENGRLELHGTIKKGAFDLTVDGIVQPISKTEFTLYGTLSGTPDLGFMDIAPTHQESSSTYTFRVKKGRKYWRLLEADGQDCGCKEDCGNDWCYVDVGPKK